MNDDGQQYELTHYGKSLSQIEKFERVEVSDDDENEDFNDPDKGKLSGKLI
jgi:hypothetical protein